jgi:protein phosphatase 2C-like protein
MSNTEWRFASATVIGSSHGKTGTPCQDHHRCRVFRNGADEPIIAIAVSDGAGSATRGEDGAAITCASLIEQAELFLAGDRDLASVTEDDAHKWLDIIRGAIADHASNAERDMRDYACTMLFALVGIDAAVFLQIGDGVIVVSDHAPVWSWVFWPDRGEFANTTFFVTDAAVADHLRFESRRGPIGEIALLTDGIEPLVLHYASRTVHAPFFERMFGPVRRSIAVGEDLALSWELESYLFSPAILQRTDDDKTLVLATCRQQEITGSE